MSAPHPFLHVAAIAASLLSSGCANMSGLDGSSKYGCKAPDGVTCDSVSGTYHNALQNNLPSQRREAPAAPAAQPSADRPASPSRSGPLLVPTTARTPMSGPEAYQGVPLRAAPRVWRLWIKPWEDADRDLNDQSLVYVQVDGGRWLLDHVQRQVRDAYAPVRPGKAAPATTATSRSAPGDPKPAPLAEPTDDAGAVSQTLRSLQGRGPVRDDN